MPDTDTTLVWEPTALEKYKKIIRIIPLFHRDIAKQVVNKKSEMNALSRGSSQIEEEDIVRAFFSEVPMTFYSMMVRLLEQAGFDYQKYEAD